MPEAILKVKDVVKTFGGLRAINGVSFELFEGEVLGLIGPNGAGKTTIFNVISGYYAPPRAASIIRDAISAASRLTSWRLSASDAPFRWSDRFRVCPRWTM
jgi:ABC-type branched-subunit amino acid transport system ATPase component